MALLASRAQQINKMAASQRLYLVLLLSTVVFASGSVSGASSKSASCGIVENEKEKYYLSFENTPESLEVGTVVGVRSIQTFGNTSIYLYDEEYVGAEVINSTIIVTLIKSLSEFMRNASSAGLEIGYSLGCGNGLVTSDSIMVIDVMDENNIAPKFEKRSYPPYKVDWDEYREFTKDSQPFDKPMSQSIQVIDGDFLVANAELSLSVACENGEPCEKYISVKLELVKPVYKDENETVHTRSSSDDPFTSNIGPGFRYSVELALLPGIPEELVIDRIWGINLTAFDGVHSNSTQLEIQFLQQKHTNDPEEGISMKTIIMISVGAGLTLLAALVAVGYFWKRTRKQKKDINRLTDAEIREFREGTSNLPIAARDSIAINVPVLTRPYNNQFEIRREDLKIDETTTLGSGVFGTVMKGTVTINHDTIPAAVKTVKKNAGVLFFKALLTELKIMAFIGKHPNIVNLIGACTQNLRKREIFVAVELCDNGTLRNYLKDKREFYVDMINTSGKLELRKNSMESVISGNRLNLYDQTITTIDLVKWSHQIANGMEFIASKRVIHGDLAARNILLDSNRVCKIADFGLSRRLFDYTKQNYTKTSQSPLPWKYMAIESLKDLTFSLNTDVWTFGVLLWEIFTLGQNPFSIYTYDESFVAKLEAGLRLELPKFATKEIREIMTDCWTAAPNDRPSIFDIKRQLGEILQNTGDYTSFMETDEGYSGSLRSTRSMWTSVNITQPPVVPQRPCPDVLY